MRRSSSRSPLAPLALTFLLVGCASAPPPAPPPAPEPERWTHERVVETSRGSITLFDPRDLAHHAAEPDGWYRYGFAFGDDLATGRFAAVLTGRDGPHRVVVTSAPLTERMRAVAGPEAVQRLRVVNRRLLLAGGDAWPSLEAPRAPVPADPRWLFVPDADYRVTITALDTELDPDLPELVFRLEEVASIDTVAYAPGMPQLVLGQPPAVARGDVSSLRYTERCDEVPRSAPWMPLAGDALPLPGSTVVVGTPTALHEERRLLANAALPADGPLIVARSPVAGAFGVQIVPRRWLAPRRELGLYRELFEMEGRVVCAVRIVEVDGSGEELRLVVEPVPMPRDRLPPALARRLLDRFESHLAMSNHPAWRYTSGRARNAPDDGSRVSAVIDQLRLPAAETEAMMPLDNEVRALRLLERMERLP